MSRKWRTMGSPRGHRLERGERPVEARHRLVDLALLDVQRRHQPHDVVAGGGREQAFGAHRGHDIRGRHAAVDAEQETFATHFTDHAGMRIHHRRQPLHHGEAAAADRLQEFRPADDVDHLVADRHGLLLIFDEVQTGVGRTGRLFAYEWSGTTPDIMTLAKGLGGGFPLGACLATGAAGKGMTAGTHGSTFGGNPLAMAAAHAVLDVVLADGFLDHVRRCGLLLKQRLAELKDRFPAVIAEVRGEGLLVGLRAAIPNGELVDELRAEKLITVAAGDNVVRLLPPLIVSDAEIAEATQRLERACSRLTQQHARHGAADGAVDGAVG